ncbi:MAG: DNA-binding response regulator [Firmicutes bacterium GWF2_51_9]|nr:response regulator transcription factor [Erysipelotrichaceae bacterium]OGS53890.1 MAG: DNA-binding response regulator [Firmicutes bacterium GWF2_51_9]HAO61524.1 DNA-binding response regulator [Erysipelotrichaceae bacterium]
MAKILFVDDESNIRRLVGYDLKTAGYDFVLCENGKQAYEAAAKDVFDVIVIDWMMPLMNGIELVEQLRRDGNEAVLMMLTAKDEEESLLEAFEAGVDDYVTKPFSSRELMARIAAHLRRTTQKQTKTLKFGQISMDLTRREVTINEKRSELTKKEFELLEYFVKNPNVVLSRDTILNEIWNFDYDGDTRIVDVHIFKLRNKLQNSNVTIRSSRGIGYILEETA